MNKLIERDNSIGNKIQFALPVLFLLYLLGYVIYTAHIFNNSNEIYLSTSFNSIVKDKYQSIGDLSIKLNGIEKRVIISNTRNCKNNPNDLSEFLSKNDRIVKNKCSDTLYVIRETKRYYFLIEDGCYNCDNISTKQWKIWNKERSIVNERNDCK